MALIVYLENQNVFVHYGIKAQMGHLGNWIQLKRDKSQAKQQEEEYRICVNPSNKNQVIVAQTPKELNTFQPYGKAPILSMKNLLKHNLSSTLRPLES